MKSDDSISSFIHVDFNTHRDAEGAFLDQPVVDEILTYLCEELGGDWLITGGTLVRLEFDSNRGTEDVDLVRLRHSTLSDEAAKTQLFRWLIDRGLGPEWVNSAVEPFVREVPEWEKETLILREGRKGRLFRPNLTLFIYLKLRRGTEIDLQDISKAIPSCPEGFDEKKLNRWSNPQVIARFARFRGQFGL